MITATAAGMHYRDLGPHHADDVLVHVHGFAISGTYLLPTASLLADRFRSIVPDLPGFGRSPRTAEPLEFAVMADQLVRVLDALGIERATFIGNSMGCPVICELDHRHRDRIERAVLVSPAGGVHTQPLRRAIGQLAQDALLERPSMARIAVPDYLRFGPLPTLRLFHAMTQSPTIERLLAMSTPSFAVLGSRDPLLPGPQRVKELMGRSRQDLDAGVILGAAHALNYSHPAELSWMIRSWIDNGSNWADGAPPNVRRVTAASQR